MFWNILIKRPDLCKGLIELILGVEVKKICLPENQKTIELKYDSRGIRLDVYLNDEAGTVYDLEMQTSLKKDIPKRTRYYQGMIDLNLIQRGSKFSELKKCYIIFICTGDVFGRKLPVYTFENICKEDGTIFLGDEAIKVIINPDSNREGLSEEMNSFLDLLQGKKAILGLARDIQEAVDDAREHREWEVEYMTLEMKYREIREEGFEEGREEGRAELIENMLKKGKSIEEIADFCGLDIEIIKEIKERIISVI